MNSRPMWKFAFKNLWLNKVRSGLALVGLSIAIIGLVTLISLSGGIKAMVTDSLSMFTGIYVMEADVIDDIYSNVPLEYMGDIEQMQGVEVVAPYITAMQSGMDGGGGITPGTPIGGMIPISGEKPGITKNLIDGGIYRKYLIRGRYIFSSDTNAAVIGSQIADDFSKQIGSSFYFASNKDKKYRVVGIFETENEVMDRLIVMPLETVREISNKDKDYVSYFVVEPSDPSYERKIISKINFKYDDVDASTASEMGQTADTILDSLDSFFLLISSVAITVGGIGILNTMLMSVMERFKEFGVLKAIGWNNIDILKLILFESIILGIIGAFVGIALSYLSVWAMSTLIAFEPVITLELVLAAVITAVLLSLVGGLYPAWKAAKLDPVEAIRFG